MSKAEISFVEIYGGLLIISGKELKSRASCERFHISQDPLTTDTARTAPLYAYAYRAESKLMSVASVQVLLFTHWGTFASMRCLSVTGRVFMIPRIKYLAPMLYDALRSQLYILPVVNSQTLYEPPVLVDLLPLSTVPEPSNASLDVPHAQICDICIPSLCALSVTIRCTSALRQRASFCFFDPCFLPEVSRCSNTITSASCILAMPSIKDAVFTLMSWFTPLA